MMSTMAMFGWRYQLGFVLQITGNFTAVAQIVEALTGSCVGSWKSLPFSSSGSAILG